MAFSAAAAAQFQQIGLPAFHDITVMAVAAKARIALTSYHYQRAVDRVVDALDSDDRLLEPPLQWQRHSILQNIEQAYQHVYAMDPIVTSDERVGKSRLQGRISIVILKSRHFDFDDWLY